MRDRKFLFSQYILLFLGLLQFLFSDIQARENVRFFLYSGFIICLQIDWFWLERKGLHLFFTALASALLFLLSRDQGSWFFLGHLLIGLSEGHWLAEEAGHREDDSDRKDREEYGSWWEVILWPFLAWIFYFARQGGWPDLIYGLTGSVISLLYFWTRSRLDRMESRERRMIREKRAMDQEKRELEESVGSIAEVYTLRERNRISREIHDSVGHSLSTIIIQLGAISALAGKKDEGETIEELVGRNAQLSAMSANLRDFAQAGLEEVRRVIAANKPEKMEGPQFITALSRLIEKSRTNSGLTISFQHRMEDFSLTEGQELALYRAVQEGLSNAARHGRAKHVRVYLIANGDELVLTITDDGCGADLVVPHVGLMGIEERIHELGGDIAFESAEGEGFTLRIVLRRAS